jgi:pyruvate formate lyase activating enzyme
MKTKKEVYLYEKNADSAVRCKNCAHYCSIANGKRGICGVRENGNGTLYALNYGKAVSVQIDPVEKKPLFHFLPGTETLSFATVGCNFACANCQNWEISQYPKEHDDIPGDDFPPQSIVDIALSHKLPSISYTYVEPTIFSEYALDTMKLARAAGLKNIWVSNGFMSKESAEMIIPHLDANNIDIKSFSDDFYRANCGARLQPVLDTAKRMKAANVWVEITTLVIPNLNDSDENLTDIANFIAKELGTETPWHVTQFSGAISWKLKHISNTSAHTLRSAYNIGKTAGLKYVYSGNIPGLETENTYCPKCNSIGIRRNGYSTEILCEGGKCLKCGTDLHIIEHGSLSVNR